MTTTVDTATRHHAAVRVRARALLLLRIVLLLVSLLLLLQTLLLWTRASDADNAASARTHTAAAADAAAHVLPRRKTSAVHKSSSHYPMSAVEQHTLTYDDVERALQQRIAQLRRAQQTVRCTHDRARVRDAKAHYEAHLHRLLGSRCVAGTVLVLLLSLAGRLLYMGVCAYVQHVRLRRCYTTVSSALSSSSSSSAATQDARGGGRIDATVWRACWHRGCVAELRDTRRRMLCVVAVKMCVAAVLFAAFVLARLVTHTALRHLIAAVVPFRFSSGSSRHRLTHLAADVTSARSEGGVEETRHTAAAALASAVLTTSRAKASLMCAWWSSSPLALLWRRPETVLLQSYVGPVLLSGVVFWLTSMSDDIDKLARKTRAHILTQHALKCMNKASKQATARRQRVAAAQRHAELLQLLRDTKDSSKLARVLEYVPSQPPPALPSPPPPQALAS